MKDQARVFLVISLLALSADRIAPVLAQQTVASPQAVPTVQPIMPEQQDPNAPPPPPAYTAPPKGTPPVQDTPEQREAIARWKAKAEQKADEDRKAHNAVVTPAYNFHYGKKNPYTPGNIQVQGEGFIQPGAFPNADYCGTCHQEAYSQWRQALHSNAFRTPFYRTSVNILIRDKTRGIAFARHCDSCHNPIGVLSGALTEDSKIDRARFDSDGLAAARIAHHFVDLVVTRPGAFGAGHVLALNEHAEAVVLKRKCSVRLQFLSNGDVQLAAGRIVWRDDQGLLG